MFSDLFRNYVLPCVSSEDSQGTREKYTKVSSKENNSDHTPTAPKDFKNFLRFNSSMGGGDLFDTEAAGILPSSLHLPKKPPTSRPTKGDDSSEGKASSETKTLWGCGDSTPSSISSAWSPAVQPTHTKPEAGDDVFRTHAFFEGDNLNASILRSVLLRESARSAKKRSLPSSKERRSTEEIGEGERSAPPEAPESPGSSGSRSSSPGPAVSITSSCSSGSSGESLLGSWAVGGRRRGRDKTRLQSDLDGWLQESCLLDRSHFHDAHIQEAVKWQPCPLTTVNDMLEEEYIRRRRRGSGLSERSYCSCVHRGWWVVDERDTEAVGSALSITSSGHHRRGCCGCPPWDRHQRQLPLRTRPLEAMF